MLGIHSGTPLQPFSFVPLILYIVRTISSLKLSPRVLSLGDSKVPVFLAISRFTLTINLHLIKGLRFSILQHMLYIFEH